MGTRAKETNASASMSAIRTSDEVKIASVKEEYALM
jgi:hypothetical protein